MNEQLIIWEPGMMLHKPLTINRYAYISAYMYVHTEGSTMQQHALQLLSS